jgi:hypothetical protein
MKPFMAILSTALLPGALMAQTAADRDALGDRDGFGFPDLAIFDPGISGGQFLIALITGVILAYCFQWLLTNLSVATGLSALQGVTDPGKREKARRKEREKEREKAEEDMEKRAERDFDEDSLGSPNPKPPYRKVEASAKGESAKGEDAEGWEDKTVKVESGVGIWALVTACISLFLACWLAVELIRVQNNLQGAILGLVIWGVFMGTMMYLEGSAISSLVGFVSGKVSSGASAVLSPLKAAAGRIGESRAQTAQREQTVKTAEEVAAAVRRELFPEQEEWQMEGPGIKDKVRDFVQSNIKPKAMDVARMGQEVKALLTDPELIEMAKRGELQNIDRNHFAEIVAGRTDLDKSQVERVVDTLHSTWSRFLGEHAPAQPTGTATNMPAMATAGSSQGMISKYRQFKEFLRSTGREELRPERLEQEVKTLVMDPKAGLSQIMEHAKELDRESLVQALGHRQDMTPEEANRIADQIDLARSKALSAKEQAEHRAQEVRDRTLSRIRDHVYAANRPELDYEGFQGDFMKLFNDPKAGYDALKKRLEGLDRESIIALLSTREGVSREDAEKMVEKGEAVKAKAEQAAGQVKAGAEKAATQAKAGVDKVADKIIEAKETVLERARQVEEETKRRMEEAKRVSLEQAEATRKVAATAAWWLLAIAVVSGAAAALGGLTAAAT